MSAPLDFFRYSGGVLNADGVSLRKIAEEHGTPTYVYSAEGFLAPLRALQKGLNGLDTLVCFAMKSNSNLSVLKLLADAGAGTDLVSGGELFRAKRAGVPSERIVFSGVGKTVREIREALLQKIYSFNVESEAELQRISETAAAMGTVAPVALRFNPDVDAKTHPYISTGLKKNKFGLERAEILKIARNSDRYPGIAIHGLSIHIGSQLLALSPLGDSFQRIKSLAQEVEKLLGHSLRFLDLGGGVGITYKSERPPEISKYCALIQKHFGKKSDVREKYRILLEPGRLISGNAGVLLSRVLYRKTRKSKDFLIIDAAMNDLLRPSLYGSYHAIVPVEKSRSSKTRTTDVVGPVCESSDCFVSDVKLPAALGSEDLVAILSSGAYGSSMSSNYNSRPRAAEVLIRDGKVEVVRQRETYEDLIRGEDR